MPTQAASLVSLVTARRVGLYAAVLAADGGFFSLTNPNRVPSPLLIVGFCLAAASIYMIISLLLAIMVVYGVPLADHGRRLALFISLPAATGLALQSVGELTSRDMVVLLLLSLVSYLYLSYSRRPTKR